VSPGELHHDGSLGDGMVIVASVRARLLGMQILKLHADVTVSPTPPRLASRPVPEAERSWVPKPEPALRNGSIGNGLEAAARSLEATTSDLNVARQRMP
jgi:hypothetical protein